MTISSVQATKGVVESGQVRALAVTGTDALAGHAERADHAGGGRAAAGRRAAVLVRDLRTERPARAA